MFQDDKSLKQIAQEKNSTAPSQLGDPVSMKAETSETQPTENDKPNKEDNRSLKEVAQNSMKTNATMLGDPVSLKAETSNTEPTKDDRGTLGANPGKPKM